VEMAEHREALHDQAEMMARSALEKATLEVDREQVRSRLEAVRELAAARA
jgi:hypothetical protein